MVLDYSEDRELLTLLRRGEISAFVDIYTTYYDALLNYADRLLNDVETARDVVQQVFYKIWENRDALSISLSVKAYLFKSVYHGCLNTLAHQKNIQKYEQEQLGISEKTVERHMSIALSKLREELNWLLQFILFFSVSHWG